MEHREPTYSQEQKGCTFINRFDVPNKDFRKDLYDYQKKVGEHTSEISMIQKQLLAYENDTSEETKATIQQLKVQLQEAQSDLEDTEYDQYINDQKKLLDELYTEYETILNERLDNIEVLVDEMIIAVNTNSGSINNTIHEIADQVGYDMSENMQSIWDNSVKDVVSNYGDGFLDKLTTTNDILKTIQERLDIMVKEVEREMAERVAASETLGYSKGGLVDYTGTAMLHGTKSKPELVLNPSDTENFIELKDILREISAKDIHVGDNGYSVESVSHNIVDASMLASAIRNSGKQTFSNNFGDINVSIPIDHVNDYNDFVNKLRSDKKFERMIQSITVDEIVGKSALSKNKFRWQ